MNKDNNIGAKSAGLDPNDGIKVRVSFSKENNDRVEEDKCNNFDFIFRKWIIFVLGDLLDFGAVFINKIIRIVVLGSLFHIFHLNLLLPHFLLFLNQWSCCC